MICVLKKACFCKKAFLKKCLLGGGGKIIGSASFLGGGVDLMICNPSRFAEISFLFSAKK